VMEGSDDTKEDQIEIITIDNEVSKETKNGTNSAENAQADASLPDICLDDPDSEDSDE